VRVECARWGLRGDAKFSGERGVRGGVFSYPVLVDHIHDGDQLPVLRPVVDEGNAPDLDVPA
jgi:hypothetical protein